MGIASERDILVLASTAGDALLEMLDELGVAGKQLHAFDGTLHLILSRENLHEEARVREHLDRRFGSAVHLVDTLGVVSAVGAGITATFGNQRRGTAALAEIGVTPRGAATSSFRISWLLDRARLAEATRALHASLIAAEPVP